jgi:hypothetical protein
VTTTVQRHSAVERGLAVLGSLSNEQLTALADTTPELAASRTVLLSIAAARPEIRLPLHPEDLSDLAHAAAEISHAYHRNTTGGAA